MRCPPSPNPCPHPKVHIQAVRCLLRDYNNVTITPPKVHIQAVRCLLRDLDASVTVKNANMQFPLHLAAIKASKMATTFLLDAMTSGSSGTDVFLDYQDRFTNTPLAYALGAPLDDETEERKASSAVAESLKEDREREAIATSLLLHKADLDRVVNSNITFGNSRESEETKKAFAREKALMSTLHFFYLQEEESLTPVTIRWTSPSIDVRDTYTKMLFNSKQATEQEGESEDVDEGRSISKRKHKHAPVPFQPLEQVQRLVTLVHP